MNKKSDVNAKQAFIHELKSRGYEARVTGAPADITATKDGQTWYFEIKMTHRTDRYFGAATMTEWKQALADSAHYRFVVAKADETDSIFEFREYTVEEFMKYSTIPPFKVYFNVPVDGTDVPQKKKEETKSVLLTVEGFEKLKDCYESLRSLSSLTNVQK